ncbi:MAG TPA: butyrate kinase [Clostridiaceae bacterium]|jgi:butyrate kinase|nr:butyrate kinase [Clostridiaceae bacterium]
MTRLLIINPGSTSTKVGIHENGELTFTKTIRHGAEMEHLQDLESQLPVRQKLILDILNEENIDFDSMDAIVGRGGLLHPLDGGVYEVNDDMIDDMMTCRYGWHSSNLGGILAHNIAINYGLKAYIADPVIVDELEPVARVSGWHTIERISIFHALNQKAVARRFCRESGRSPQDCNLIIAHMGGGISVGAHRKGKVIDVNNALSGDGPFSPERSGGLPIFALIELCYSGQYSERELKKALVGGGGLTSYFGTNDAREVEHRMNAGDEKAGLIYEAMAYQIAKEIGSAAAVLKGDVEAILLTGGLANSEQFVEWIVDRIDFIAPVHVYPGEDELSALGDAVREALAGHEPIHIYEKE